MNKKEILNILKNNDLLSVFGKEKETIDYFFDNSFELDSFKKYKIKNQSIYFDCIFNKHKLLKIQFYISNLTPTFYCFKYEKNKWKYVIKFCGFEQLKNWIEKNNDLKNGVK